MDYVYCGTCKGEVEGILTSGDKGNRRNRLRCKTCSERVRDSMDARGYADGDRIPTRTVGDRLNEADDMGRESDGLYDPPRYMSIDERDQRLERNRRW